jgi:copper chaperone
MVSLSLFSTSTKQEFIMYQLTVQDMTCQGCAAAITRAINAVDKHAQIRAFPATRKVEVTSTLSGEQLLSLLNDAGYPAQLENNHS